MAWLCNAPNVEQTLQHDDASNRRQLFDFIDSFVCTHNPAVLPDGSNLDTAPNASINPHVYSRPHSDIEDYNADLVSTCQRHTRCSTSYCLQTKQGQQQYRFGYYKKIIQLYVLMVYASYLLSEMILWSIAITLCNLQHGEPTLICST